MFGVVDNVLSTCISNVLKHGSSIVIRISRKQIFLTGVVLNVNINILNKCLNITVFVENIKILNMIEKYHLILVAIFAKGNEVRTVFIFAH